ncbi:MAG: serine hydrolase domain-containing protein [Chloroflexota bacterium]
MDVNSKEFWAPLERLIRYKMATHSIPGLAVAFARDGEVVYSRGFGYADLDAGRAVAPETIFGVASVTKSFTCLAVMQLADAGKLSPEDPVVKHLPEFRLPDERATRAATISHLMSHTAGLPPLPVLEWAIEPSHAGDPLASEYTPVGEVAQAHKPINTVEDVLAYLAEGEYTLTGQPGEVMSYSNDSYGLLGLIIERVSGEPYAKYMRDHIFTPLGMTRTTFDIDEAKRLGDVTELYARDKHDVIRHSPKWSDFPALMACGQLRSTVLDLLKYGNMYVSGGQANGRTLLSPTGVEEMLKPRVQTGRDRWYAYGMNVHPDYHGVRLVGHSGGLKGVSSYYGYCPEQRLVGAVTVNLGGVPASHIWMGGMNLLLGRPVDEPWAVEPEYQATHAELERFVGVYPSGEGDITTIAWSGDKLTVTYSDGRPFVLRASGPDTVVYQHRDDETVIRLVSDENGVPYAIRDGSRFIRKAKQ